MRTIGFILSPKENEKRTALLPKYIKKLNYPEQLFFETGYGEKFGIDDEEYIKLGANIVSREEALKKDIVCDPKIGDGDYIKDLDDEQIIFGWVHAVQNRELTDLLLEKRLTAIAWEDMYEGGRHVFWRNNEIAGEAAIMQAFCEYGKFPYEAKVAILGRGNTARGAYRILNGLGADITVYSRNMEKLLRKEIGKYDVIVNAILWDTTRKDHLIYREDLNKMKKDAIIIDVSCDANKGVETSKITTIENPTYYVDGVMHYVVDHTPSLFYKTATESISEQIYKYIDILIDGREDDNKVLSDSIIIRDGEVLDKKIIEFQHRRFKKSNIA
ncbi:N(5)-(carboxyethyl)ornithine synthase [Clostridium rectalis]|uniref:N(5)-(carboxyethyl)ornithine synthase n=1 Tax=Clostridium rectalis TaxID=2040295 RepID=UPI000F63A8CD|nr:N(5)-(carboxyethyl)ornithine synthase [Clostridium rectalis]